MSLRVIFAALFFAIVKILPAQGIHTGDIPSALLGAGVERWYRSNSAGMTLEVIPSRAAAMQQEFSLLVRSASARELPPVVLPHFNGAYGIELRALYEEGRASRFQWIFRDSRGMTRVTAAGRGSLFATRPLDPLFYYDEEDRTSGIIELRNNEGDVTREFQFNEDHSEWDFRYFHRDGILVRAEIWFREPPAPVSYDDDSPPPAPNAFTLVFTDLYRYTRSGSLRAIDRTLHAGAERERLSFPRLGPGASLGENLISHGGAHTAEHFVGVQAAFGITISYNLDIRGRILGETWRNEDGEIIGELANTWVGDRLQSALWRAPGDERLTEFDFDDEGYRVAERNFRNGVLERSVTSREGLDIEEVFMNGMLVLRAVWENGIRISEERISPVRGRP